MPTYTDPSTGKRIRSDEPLDDSELEEAFGPSDTAGQRAGSYLSHKANEYIGSGQNLLADIMGTSQPAGRTNWQRAADVGTVAGPFIAPEMTAAGLAAGTGARAYGADEGTADLANAGTQLLTGGVQAARSAGGLASRTAARFKGVADTMAQRGTLLKSASPEGKTLFWALADALRGSANGAEKTAAQSVMDMLANGTSPTYGDLDKALQQVQGLGRDSAVAGVLRSARDAMTQGTPEAKELGRAYAQSGLSRIRIPGNLASRGISGGLGTAGAIAEARRGNYGRAAASLALGATGAGASVGHALAAAGPAARTAAALSGPAIKSLGSGDEGTPVGGAHEPEQAPVSDMGVVASKPAAKPPAVGGPFGHEIAAVASVVGVPAQLLHGVMRQESSGNPGALSHPAPDQVQTPAHGLMQITPGTFDSVAREASALLGRQARIENPLDNIVAGGLLWRKYLDKTNGDVEMAARLYHGGENPAAWGPRTHQYGQDILQRFAEELR